MLPGPVFNVELLTTSRRARYYAVRALYGLILLYVLWSSYSSQFWWYRKRATISIHELSEFASRTFLSIALAQIIAVLVLTPTLVAGTIADEKQRKTLHYLLASRLTSGEIVLGKLAARLLHVGVFLALGMPVVSLIGLFGGVDPLLVTCVYAGTFSTAFVLAGISIWISTVARRVRDAIFAVYLIELAWLLSGPALYALSWITPRLYPWIKPVVGLVLATNPFYTVVQGTGPMPGTGSFLEAFFWLVGLHTAGGVLLIALSVWRLRPIFRTQGGEAARSSWLSRTRGRLRSRRRPECGDDPMFWKERYFVRAGGLVRWIIRILAVVGGVFMAYWVVYFTEPAIRDLLEYGFSTAGQQSAREDLNMCLRVCTTALYVLWILGVGAAAACGITGEKEEDTWTSLTTTTLTGSEIVGAKMIGAVWSMRVIGVAMISLWLLGVALAAIHPFGLLAVLLEWAVFTAFVAALGTYVSLHARNTTRALAVTVGVLVTCNGLYMMCCVPFRPDTFLMMVGCTPAMIAISQLSFQDLWGLLGFIDRQPMHRAWEGVLTCILAVIGYGVSAIALTFAAVNGFDQSIDRPRRRHWGEGPPVPIKPRPTARLQEF